jgi:hypothetical protein
MYRGSVRKLLEAIYPEYEWDSWKFRSRGFWASEQNKRNWLLNFIQTRNITTKEEWNGIL